YCSAEISIQGACQSRTFYANDARCLQSGRAVAATVRLSLGSQQQGPVAEKRCYAVLTVPHAAGSIRPTITIRTAVTGLEGVRRTLIVWRIMFLRMIFPMTRILPRRG
ncbi:hypothetical protein BIW11_11990, partial [Tropilaelaps mercedesae]